MTTSVYGSWLTPCIGGGGGFLADLSILRQNVNKNTARAFALAPDHPVAAQYAGGLVDSL
jgi:hypothetical protein